MPRFALLDVGSDIEDDDSDQEPPHPLGFDASPQIGIYSDGQSRYFFDENEDLDSPFYPWSNEPPIGKSTQQALLSAHVNTETTPMKTLIKYANLDAAESQKTTDDPPPDSIQSYSDAMNDLSVRMRELGYEEENRMPDTAALPLPVEYAQIAEKEKRIQRGMIGVKQKFEAKQEQRRKDIKILLEKEQARSTRRLEKQRLIEEKAEAERVAQEMKDQEIQRKAQAEKDRVAAVEAERKRQIDAENAKKKAERDRIQAAEQKALDAAKAATEYIRRAEKLVAQLKPLRASVEPFDKSKPMAKRRLGMKKIVNGKVNTLAEDIDKIRSVAQDVSAAIAQAKQEDSQIEDLIKNGNTEYTKDMAKGKRYFVDLLCSKVIVRVQAEGFNGQRGDGFPLAHMLAIVAAEHKDIIPVLAAHVYAVCPTAIPRLPNISKDASENELMESLGMIKDKAGNYESFERFLGRTEGLISIVADIMSSEPSDHQLFGGHGGAVKWLARFLSELPNSSPLPLITAPVLDAFLTGAGHMLALAYPDEFQKYLKTITTDVLPKLDEGAIGKPSATRLEKTLSGGFESFKDKLPSRAIGELYHGSTASGFKKELSSAPKNSANYQPPKERKKKDKDQQQQQQQQQANAGPFGGGGGGAQQSPFGQNQGAPGASPFGQAPAQAQSPFGQSNNTSSFGGQSMSSFGSSGGGEKQDSMVPDNAFGSSQGGSMMASNTDPSPFGNQQPTSGAGPFGSPNPTGNAPFGQSEGFGSPAPAAGPFGGPAPAAGFGAAAPAPSPFGGNSNSNSSPFGGGGFGNNNPNPSPFSAAPSSGPFGSSAPQAQGAFGQSQGGFGSPAPAAGFGAAAPAPSPFSNNNNNNNTPFGGGGGGGGNNSNSPFGGGGFGNNNANPSPFSSGPSSGPFGGGGGGFGGQNSGGGGGGFGGQNRGGGGGGNKAPCKFFAQGNCRYGNNCKFSHDVGGGGGGGNNNSFSNPFGGGPRR